MGIYDREYMSDKGQSGMAGWPMMIWLLIANTIVFIIQHAVMNNEIAGYLSLSKDTLFRGEVWRLLTTQFSHGHPGHFIFNMVGLFFIGRMVEPIIGRKNLLWTYLLGGLLGGLFHVGLQLVVPATPPVVGASGAILALLMTLVAIMPEQPIQLLFLPFQFKVKYIGYVLIAMNVLGAVFSFTGPAQEGGTSYMAHLGGIAAGWLFAKFLLPILTKRETRTENRKEVRKQRSKLKEAEAARRKQEKSQKETVYLDQKVDDILEKISEQGMHSLTAEEKKILERSSERLSKKLGDK